MRRYEDAFDRPKCFLYDDEIYKTDEEVIYALNITDMGSIERGCVSLFESEYKLIKQAVEQEKQALMDSLRGNKDED
jgi:hypothetical protein